METPHGAPRALVPGQVVKVGAWGAGRPSFPCSVENVALPGPDGRGGKVSFLVREEFADRFRREHPDCRGARLLAIGNSRVHSKEAARLVTAQPPRGAIVSSARKRGSERFENEQVQLTDDGREQLVARTRLKLIVWALDFRCGGIDTYVNTSDAPITLYASPSQSAKRSGTVAPDSTVLALETKTLSSSGTSETWIRLRRGWVVADTLSAAGCQRQCGGFCACATTCTQQVKARHGCDLRLLFDRTLPLVDRGLVRATVSGKHRYDGSTWAPLPLEERPMTVAVKQEVLAATARKQTAKMTQLALNLAAEQKWGVSFDPRGACLDRAEVPKQCAQPPLTSRECASDSVLRAVQGEDPEADGQFEAAGDDGGWEEARRVRSRGPPRADGAAEAARLPLLPQGRQHRRPLQRPRCGQRLNRTRLGPQILRCQRRLLADHHLRRGLPQRRRTLRAQRP